MFFGSRDPHTQTVLEYAAEPRMVETTWVPALFTAFREVIDNALDEVVTHRHGDRIDITYDPATLTCSVTDNGRGVPIEWSEPHQKHAATVLFSEMNSGRNYHDDRGETRGLNGIGAKGVNFCSEWFKVEIHRDKKVFTQHFAEAAELHVDPPTIMASSSRKTGTTISFKLSPQVFPTLSLPEHFVEARIHEIALCYPHITLTYNGKKVTANTATLFNGRKPIVFDIEDTGFRGRFWLVSDFHPEGEFAFSLVNAIPLFNGGTHIDALKRSFYSGLLAALERESRRRKLQPNRADLSDGLLIYAIMEMAAPSFDSQSKSRLINEHIGKLVSKTLDKPEFFRDVIRQNPEWIERIYARCAERTQAKDDKAAKQKAKRNLRQRIEDLEDACGVDRGKCVLFITEGRSACAGITEARDPTLCGALPLRGKILNVHAETAKTVLENEALSKIMNSIGLSPGQRVNRHALRYGRAYLTCDADEDGKNIASLLINFFYRFWPELFDPQRPPFIYVFNTPLIIAANGKKRRYWYNDDYGKFSPEKYHGWEITRAKGLAALKREDWKHVLDNPRTVPIVDDGGLKQTLDLLFNAGRAAERRAWMGL